MRNNKEILPVLIKATSLLTSNLELSKILPQAMQIIKDLILDCDAASIMLVDQKNKNLIFEVALGEKGQEIKKIALPLGKGIAGKVAISGKPILVKNAQEHKNFDKSFDEKSGFKTRSVLCVPIEIKNKVIGIAEAMNPRNKDVFDETDTYLLSLFCNQLALGIEDARMHKKILAQKRLEDELTFAHKIQSSFLPSEFPKNDGYSFWAQTISARRIGGDFYDVQTPEKNRIDFIIGDVSGKGIPAALFMARTLSQLRIIASKHTNKLDPSLILNELNSSIFPNNIESMFVTLIYGIYLINERKIILSNSAHPSPYVYKQNSKVWQELEQKNGPPIGLIKKPEFTNSEITLEKGDISIFYTDCFNETLDSEGNPFVPQILSELPANSNESAEIGNSLISKLYEFTKSEQLFDDATSIILKSR